MQLILKDCVVFENWRGGRGSDGKSFNKYDPATAKWEQFWVSDTGTTTHYQGSFSEGAMRFTATAGAQTIHLTFSKLPDGSVRQLSELSADGGKRWAVQYDFTYRRKQGGAPAS